MASLLIGAVIGASPYGHGRSHGGIGGGGYGHGSQALIGGGGLGHGSQVLIGGGGYGAAPVHARPQCYPQVVYVTVEQDVYREVW